ncbi:hypothetical protein 278BB001_72 [Bacillus phage 278BB001]|nr:hypothetical protein 010DV004_84 [Bacillus phage 010DV004]QZA69301.1 hypothetical protein 010DV005_84 [Bacillus phage 010DV005]QZA69869.1 hypothetical protein 043JT007_83 [Bacillus phage 043JT007]QZA70223.1 hypothetical protein 278BB001_72 [Bacillus phage 278BB001]
MKEQIKAAIKEMIKNGELNIGIEWESMWSELYVTVSIDGEELSKESVYIKEIKTEGDY